VRAAAITRSPQRLTTYARELAAVFHVFYHNCPVLRADPGTAAFRLDLCRLTRYVIARSLDLVGVAAPEKM
jgi:arginyl-tRNA synthetase